MAVAKVGGVTTGLPPGVFVAPLGARLVAFLIDRSVPVVLSGVASIIAVQVPDARTIVFLVAGVLILAWGLLVWQMYAVRAAGPGMRLMKLQLVGYTDGRPIGWGRFFLRWLVLSLLSATGIGLILMIVFLVLQPRRQGWHDLAADSVVIKERVLAPPRSAGTPNSAHAAGPRTAEVLPPQQQDLQPPQTQPQPQPDLQPPTYQPAMQSEAGAEAYPSAPASPAPLENEPTAQQPVPVESMAIAAHDPRPLNQDWKVVLDDGREIDVTGLVLLGRNPQPRAGEEDAQLIKVADDSRTVSKSHLAIGVDGNGMYVMDRNSTNGSTVTTSDGATRKCPPGDIVPVQPGTVVSFGDHWLEVSRPWTPRPG